MLGYPAREAHGMCSVRVLCVEAAAVDIAKFLWHIVASDKPGRLEIDLEVLLNFFVHRQRLGWTIHYTANVDRVAWGGGTSCQGHRRH